MTKTSNAFVTYPLDSLMYIIIDDEATFDAIALDLEQGKASNDGHGRVVKIKSGRINEIDVVFQFWSEKQEVTG